ncbi:MAG: hypothetical protein Q9217_003339 [Psora testacea]
MAASLRGHLIRCQPPHKTEIQRCTGHSRSTPSGSKYTNWNLGAKCRLYANSNTDLWCLVKFQRANIAQPNPPAVTGAHLTLVPRDIYIAADLPSSISSAIKANSPELDSPKCQSAIHSVLAPAEQDLQKRQLVTAGAI